MQRKLSWLVIVALILASTILVLNRSSLQQDAVTSRQLSKLVDPKTIIRKFDTHSTEGLRVLTLGDSIAWGATLKDRLTEAFPYLVSTQVTNLAIRANGPNFPAVCTETMIGIDMVYDVIILEYFIRAQEGLMTLASRIRQRFPHAAIIFLRLWFPEMLVHNPSQLRLRDWVISNGVSQDLNSKDFQVLIRTTNSETDWTFRPIVATATTIQDEVVKIVDGTLWEFPRDSDPIQTLLSVKNLFAMDWHHLSAAGHQVVADGIKAIFKELNLKRQNLVIPWAQHDSCESWFSTGKSSISHGPEWKMENFVPEGPKYGLDLLSPRGWITFKNPFQEVQMLHLAYMVTGPPPGMYQKVRIPLRDHPEFPLVEINPVVEALDGHNIHIVHMIRIVRIPPSGSIILEFERVMEEHRILPFRLTGYAITHPDSILENIKASSFHDFSNHIIPDHAHTLVTNGRSDIR